MSNISKALSASKTVTRDAAGIIYINGYLTQKKLEQALRYAIGEGGFSGDEIPVNIPPIDAHPASVGKWDMMFKINGVDTVIEFDGDRHYCDSLTIRRDKLKDEVARKANMKVIRFPYWLQLTTETLEYYFGLSTTIVQDFPHGFITTKIFPASFCALGIERFQGELGALPENIIFDVLGSLEDRRIKYGDEFVTTGMKAQIRGAIPVRSAIESWITVEEFIHRSKAVHGEKEYDYTKVKGERLPKIVEHEKKRLHMAMPTAQRGWLYIGE